MPDVTITVPLQLRKLVDGSEKLCFTASTSDEILQRLHEDYPRLALQLLDEQGHLRRFVRMYINGRDSRHFAKTGERLTHEVSVSLIPAFSGG